MYENIIKLLPSFVCSIISGLAILPIASDGIRSMLFGRRKRAMQSAKKDLLETIEGMLLSGQSISDPTYNALADNLANKYNIKRPKLGSKDENIVTVLQTINSSKIVPNDIKRLVSNHIQLQIGNNLNQIENLEEDYERMFDSYNFNEFDFDESLKRKTEYGQDIGEGDTYINRVQRLLILFTVVGVGALTAVGVYYFNVDNIFAIVICLSAILNCINILTSLMDAAEFPTPETIKRLVYNVAFIIVLISLLLVSGFIKAKP